MLTENTRGGGYSMHYQSSRDHRNNHRDYRYDLRDPDSRNGYRSGSSRSRSRDNDNHRGKARNDEYRKNDRYREIDDRYREKEDRNIKRERSQVCKFGSKCRDRVAGMCLRKHPDS